MLERRGSSGGVLVAESQVLEQGGNYWISASRRVVAVAWTHGTSTTSC